MIKQVRTKELFDSCPEYLQKIFDVCEFPWQMLPMIKSHIACLLEEGIEGFTLLSDGFLVGEHVTILPSAVIIPPAIIGSGTFYFRFAF